MIAIKKSKRLIAVYVLVFCFTYVGYSQDKLFFLGGSTTFNPDSIGYTISFSFNRTESADPGSGPIVKAWNVKNGLLFLKPSASADLGSIPKIAEDNVFINLIFGYHKSLHKGFLFTVEFAPSYTSDKNFQTGLIFADLVPKFGYRYFNESIMEHLIFFKVGLDYGVRVGVHSSPNTFIRAIPDLSYKCAFFPKIVTDPKGNAVFKYFRLTANFQGTLYLIYDDNTVIANGSYGYFMGSIDYMICKNVAVGLRYVKGYVQPAFNQVDALSIGFSIYR